MSDGPYEYDAFLRQGNKLTVGHCIGEDIIAEFSHSTMSPDEIQAAAAAVLESRGCRPVGGSWSWTVAPSNAIDPDYKATFVRDEALWA